MSDRWYEEHPSSRFSLLRAGHSPQNWGQLFVEQRWHSKPCRTTCVVLASQGDWTWPQPTQLDRWADWLPKTGQMSDRRLQLFTCSVRPMCDSGQQNPSAYGARQSATGHRLKGAHFGLRNPDGQVPKRVAHDQVQESSVVVDVVGVGDLKARHVSGQRLEARCAARRNHEGLHPERGQGVQPGCGLFG